MAHAFQIGGPICASYREVTIVEGWKLWRDDSLAVE